ncbi:synaptotagmin-7-like isoform X2 [Ostrea edulis]|uniref:synaptotagmin-7-like isoform X2 n=1 Tax=Ostrea edulis TaxID=37623 RepID=UPI0024AEF3C3|nr:synaptotagmin-7-like isoform X2 [Ostrea edulis]
MFISTPYSPKSDNQTIMSLHRVHVEVKKFHHHDMEESGEAFLAIISAVGSLVVLVVAVLLCGWCIGKTDDDDDEDEFDSADLLSQKYTAVAPQDSNETEGVRVLNKRSWEAKSSMQSTPIMLRRESVKFERPSSRNPVVTEQVQPSANAHTSLNESLGVRNGASAGPGPGNYQAMGGTPTHRPLMKNDSQKSQSADDVNSSLWKGMRNIAFTLMENASQDAEVVEAASAIDVTEGVDCKLGRLHVGLSYDFQSLTLTLKVIQATGLVAKDFTGTSDPYVKILLLPDKRHKLVTKVKKKNLNPRWNESFLFEGWPHNKLLEKTIYLQVIDYDRFSRDDPIGETYIPLNEVDLSQSPFMWRYLQPCKDSRGKLGEVLLSLSYQPTVGRLNIIVMKCKDLKAKDITGASDPYVKLWLKFGNNKIEKKKTSIKMRTLNPVYNESFFFEIPWEKIREAAIEVIVMDFDKVGRNEMIGKIVLSSKSGPLETRHWNDMITKPRQQVAQWHLLKD